MFVLGNVERFAYVVKAERFLMGTVERFVIRNAERFLENRDVFKWKIYLAWEDLDKEERQNGRG